MPLARALGRLVPVLAVTLSPATRVHAQIATSATPVYIKLEVEDFGGFEKYKAKDETGWEPRMAWYPQWSRGGDSGWWAAEVGPKVTGGEITNRFTVSQDGDYALWVRYEDYAGKAEPFVITIEGGDGKTETASFGRADIAKPAPPFPYAYAWDKATVALKKGEATIAIAPAGAAEVRRSLDAVVLTTDANWKPENRGFPPMAYAGYLLDWSKKREPLPPLVQATPPSAPPQAWSLPRTGSRDFWYLGAGEFISGFPKPVHIQGAAGTAEAYAKLWGGKPDAAPVFSSPAVGLKLGVKDIVALLEPDGPMRKYILENQVPFAVVGNYASAGKIPGSYDQLKHAYGDLWVGIISGEGSYLGLPVRPEGVAPGPDFKEQNYQWIFKEGRAKWREAISGDWATPVQDPFEKFILAASVGTMPIIHRLAEAGAKVVATESAAVSPYIPVQIAFARGAARQYGIKWMWYYGASYGDAIRTFTAEGPYVLELEGMKVDNRNATIGPSLPHIRRQLLNVYLQDASFWFPEQGYNLIGPDGQINPMGWCYDEMARLAARHPDRGVTYTPVAVLLDKAHGWDKYEYNGERIWGVQPMGRPDRMIDGFFNVAYFPFPKNEGDPVDDLGVPWPNGYFGDIFDVLVTSPTKTDAINAYPMLFCVGDTKLDAKWVAAVKAYVDNGGTLIINTKQVATAAPGLDDAFLGAKLSKTVKEASAVKCAPDGAELAGTLFPYTQVTPGPGEVVATAVGTNDPIAVVNKVGKGKVILTTPSYLLGWDGVPTPYMARLLQQVTSGVMPVEVRGNCEHYVNLHPKGYVVVVSNNEGIAKGSHSAAKLDPSKETTVTIRSKTTPAKSEEWIGEDPRPWSLPNEWLLEYTQPLTLDWKPDGSGAAATLKLRPGELRVIFVQTQ